MRDASLAEAVTSEAVTDILTCLSASVLHACILPCTLVPCTRTAIRFWVRGDISSAAPRGEQAVKDLVHLAFHLAVAAHYTELNAPRGRTRHGRVGAQRTRLVAVVREPTHVLEVRRALGRYLATCRRRAHWSQGKLASETHYHRTAISHLEAGRHPAPRDFWDKADRLLAAGGALLKLYEELVTTKRDYAADAVHQQADDAEGDPVLAAPWNHRGTVSAGVALHCDDDAIVKRRRFAMLTGAALTVPAHQWLIRESEPLGAGLSGGRISVTLIDQLSMMISTLSTGRLGRSRCWSTRVGQRYHIAALHAAHSADDRVLGAHILGAWPIKRPVEVVPPKP